jgi:LCP family protein required for cell wall assembly
VTSSKPPYRRFRAHGPEEVHEDDAINAIRSLRHADEDNVPRTAREREAQAQRRTPPRKPTVRPAWWSFRHRSAGAIARRLLAIFAIVTVIWGLAGFIALRGAAAEANRHVPSTARRALSDPGGGLLGTAENTLVIGSDSRHAGTGGRADTIMIMRTNPGRGTLSYLSLPRDLRVAWGENHIKLGETFSHRGITGLVRTIRNELDIPIHHVMIVDFGSVSHMVDAVGGVTINNPFNLVDCPYAGGITVTFRKGTIHLDGKRALQYSRVRKCDTDINRAQRQQLLVAALKSKMLSVRSLPLAPFRGAKIVRTLSTDMGTIDLMKFGWLQARLNTGTREVLATQGAMIGSISYQLLDPNAAGPQLRTFLEG